MRKSLLAFLALCVGLGVCLAGGAAWAMTDQNCAAPMKTRLLDRPDNSANGVWALLDMNRTVVICVDQAPEEGLWSYTATVKDEGTLTTTGPKSPREGLPLAPGIKGTVVGEYTEKFKAPGNWVGYNPALLNGEKFTGTGPMVPTTPGWIKWVWPTTQGNTLDPYKWTYKTCSETWISGTVTNDGTIARAGDITGKACPTTPPPVVVTTTTKAPTQPPVVTTTTTVATSTSTSPIGGIPGDDGTTLAVVPLGNDSPTSLPVTGNSGLQVVMWSGAMLVLLGAFGIAWAVRRHRDTAE